jgi:hypothetical protein
VPLSEHEQRLFEEIERSLADDPKFANAVRASDPRHHAKRRLVIAGLIVLAGLALLVLGAVNRLIPLGVAGAVVMFGALFVLRPPRRNRKGRLRSVGGTASRRTSRRGSLADRLEEKWRRRGLR